LEADRSTDGQFGCRMSAEQAEPRGCRGTTVN
jgi:hypothetical protein